MRAVLYSNSLLRRTLQQEQTLPRACRAVGRRDRLECGLHLPVHVEADLGHEVVQALAAEDPLHLREDRLDRVEFRRITDVPYRLHIQFRPPFFDARLLVDVQIVHKQRNRVFSYFLTELFEVVAEVFARACMFVNLDQPNSMFLGHACYH